jgi:hypothetical protein
LRDTFARAARGEERELADVSCRKEATREAKINRA